MRSWWLSLVLLLGCSAAEPRSTPMPAPPAPSSTTTASAASTASASTTAAAAAAAVPTDAAPPADAMASGTPVDAGSLAGSVVTLGPFDRWSLPKSKLALIEIVVRALRTRDAGVLGRVWLDDSLFRQLCPGLPAAEYDNLAEDQNRSREKGAEDFGACLALADWSQAERLALNYGSRTQRASELCSYQYLTHENPELFFIIGDTVYKVELYDAVTYQGWHALGRRLRCSKKQPGSGADARAFLKSAPASPCPQVPWPAVTQIREGCPSM